MSIDSSECDDRVVAGLLSRADELIIMDRNNETDDPILWPDTHSQSPTHSASQTLDKSGFEDLINNRL